MSFEKEKITDNVMLVWEDECYLFTDVKNLEYIEIEASSDYDGGCEIDVDTERQKLDINTTDYTKLRLLVALGKLTESEADKRYGDAQEKQREACKRKDEIEQEAKDKVEYKRLKVKYEGGS